jgi:cytochrome c oxidase assembly protein subunit 15
MKRFHKVVTLTFWATLGLVVAGGLVRATGAGLGCPDWPTCWGCWLPPTELSDIPSQLDEAGEPYYLDKLDRRQYLSKFDSTKMWIEYMNRVLGVLIGIFIIATFVVSFPLRKSQPRLFWGSLAALLMVIFQGWLGSIVVESELMPGMITLHMLLAMILLSLLISLQAWSSPGAAGVVIPGTRILYGLIILQVILGTQVREKVDEFTKDGQGIVREEWLDHAGLVDHLHRPLSLLVLGLSLFIFFQAKKKNESTKMPVWILAGVGGQILLGIVLAYAGLPPWSQTAHLVLGAGLLCLVYRAGWHPLASA